MKKILVFLFLLITAKVQSQELFVYTEPASNMATGSIGLRLNNYFMKATEGSKVNYHLLPEIMWGASRKLMVHAEGFLSNEEGKFMTEGGAFYAKYRFYSIDEVHSHFRLAAFGRYSFNNSSIHQQAIDFNGHSSGYEGGVVATRLINKLAISAIGSVMHATDNGAEKFPFGNKNRTAISYSLSAGKLLLPKEYVSYGQTNLNFMLELLGQTNTGSGDSFLDIAPSVQFIFNSRMRVDLGYRAPLIRKLQRTADRGCLVRLEYNFFNLIK